MWSCYRNILCNMKNKWLWTHSRGYRFEILVKKESFQNLSFFFLQGNFQLYILSLLLQYSSFILFSIIVKLWWDDRRYVCSNSYFLVLLIGHIDGLLPEKNNRHYYLLTPLLKPIDTLSVINCRWAVCQSASFGFLSWKSVQSKLKARGQGRCLLFAPVAA